MTDPVKELMGLLNGYAPCCAIEQYIIAGNFDYNAFLVDAEFFGEQRPRGRDGRPIDPDDVFKKVIAECKNKTHDIMCVPFGDEVEDMQFGQLYIVFQRRSLAEAAALRTLLIVAWYDHDIKNGEIGAERDIERAVRAYFPTPMERHYAIGVLYGYNAHEISAYFAHASLRALGIGQPYEWWISPKGAKTVVLDHLRMHKEFYGPWSRSLQRKMRQFLDSPVVADAMKEIKRRWLSISSL